MTETRCAYCGEPSEGRFTIHRDGFGVGPEVPLCDACGGDTWPSLYDIWYAIAQPSDDDFAFRRVETER